ncbi:MAG: SDR family NAD(P)-dependent oxidoreductase, partial [Promethearchaeota archaeon]
YRGKVFLITGAGGDIGSEVCRKFAPLGMRIYLLDLPGVSLNELKGDLEKLGAEYVENYECDVTNREQVESVIKNIGEKEKHIDILHNHAGIGTTCSITNGGTFNEYRKIMSINVDSMWLILQAALPYIGRPAPTKKYPDRKEGQIIFTSSSAGKIGIPNMAAYSMSKYAIVGLADSLRLEFKMKNHNIQVITICPAPTKTKFWDSTPEMKEWVKKYQKRGFLYKFVDVKDVAKVILKASRKYKREIFVPRFYWLIAWLQLTSHKVAGKFLIKIEKSKLDIPKN